MNDVFAPIGRNFTASPTTATGSGGTAVYYTLQANMSQIVVYNAGTVEALLGWGNSQTDAQCSATDGEWKVSIGPGQMAAWTKGANTILTAMCPTGTTTLRIMQGIGE